MYSITNKAVLLEWPDTGALTSVDLLKERIHTGEEEKSLKLQADWNYKCSVLLSLPLRFLLHEQLPFLVSGAPLCAV